MKDFDLWFEEISEKQYQELLDKTQNHTFYNSPERFQFLRSQEREVKFFGIYSETLPIGLLHFQVIAAKSGRLIYFQHTPLLFDSADKEKITELFAKLKEFTKEQMDKYDVQFARFTPRIPKNYSLLQALYKLGYKRAPIQEIDASVTRVIHIQDFDLKKIRKTTRNCINAGLKTGLYTKIEKQPETFNTFVKFYNAMEKLKGFTPLSNRYLTQELAHYRDQNMLTQYTTYTEDGSPASICIVITFRDTAYYYHAATSTEGKHLNSSHVNLYHVIEDLKKNKDLKVLDLWGGATSKVINENNIRHPWQNLDLFKRGFSDELLEFLPPLDLPRNWISYLVPYVYQWLLTKKRGYPIID